MTNTNSPHSSSTAGLTTTQATTSLIKGIIGAGTFSMPWAFRQSGLLAGIIVVFILALWSAHTIKLLAYIKRLTLTSLKLLESTIVKAASIAEPIPTTGRRSISTLSTLSIDEHAPGILDMSKLQGGIQSEGIDISAAVDIEDLSRQVTIDFRELHHPSPNPWSVRPSRAQSLLPSSSTAPSNIVESEAIDLTYYELGRLLLGPNMSVLISFCVLACAIGVSTAYLDFIRCLTQKLLPSVNQMLILALLFPIIAGLCLLRSFQHIALTAIVGDVAILAGAACTLFYGIFVQGILPLEETMYSNDNLYFHPSTFPLFLAVAGFLFCVHFFVLPIEQAMENPSNFSTAVNWSFTLTAILNCLFGVLGYLCFGEDTRSIVLQNVLSTSGWTIAIKLLLCVDMVFSYVLVIIPGRQLAEEAALGCLESAQYTVQDNTQPPPLINVTTPLLSRVQLSPSSIHVLPPTQSCRNTHRVCVGNNQRTGICSNNNTTASCWSTLLGGPRLCLSAILQRTGACLGENGLLAVTRLLVVALTFALCIALPMFSVVISLVGGVSMVALAFVFPALMALKYIHTHTRAPPTSSAPTVSTNGQISNGNKQTQQNRLLSRAPSLSSVAPHVTIDSLLLFGDHAVAWFGRTGAITISRIYYYICVLFGILIMILTMVTQANEVYKAMTDPNSMHADIC